MLNEKAPDISKKTNEKAGENIREYLGEKNKILTETRTSLEDFSVFGYQEIDDKTTKIRIEGLSNQFSKSEVTLFIKFFNGLIDDRFIKILVKSVTDDILKTENLNDYFKIFNKIAIICGIFQGHGVSVDKIADIFTKDSINKIKVHLTKLPKSNSLAENILDGKITNGNKNLIFSDIRVVKPQFVDNKYFEFLGEKEKRLMQKKIADNCDLVVFMDNINENIILENQVSGFAVIPFRMIFVGTKSENGKSIADWYIGLVINHELDHIVESMKCIECKQKLSKSEIIVRQKELEYAKSLLKNPNISTYYRNQIEDSIKEVSKIYNLRSD